MHPTFQGGIHLPGNRYRTETSRFINLSIPQYCYIPMKQHPGAPAKPVVRAGAMVREGQIIGEAQGSSGANVHASVPGRVVDVIQNSEGKKKLRS